MVFDSIFQFIRGTVRDTCDIICGISFVVTLLFKLARYQSNHACQHEWRQRVYFLGAQGSGKSCAISPLKAIWFGEKITHKDLPSFSGNFSRIFGPCSEDHDCTLWETCHSNPHEDIGVICMAEKIHQPKCERSPAFVIVVTFSVVHEEDFQLAQTYIHEIRGRFGTSSPRTLLVGTMCEKRGIWSSIWNRRRHVKAKTAQAFADRHCISYIEVSKNNYKPLRHEIVNNLKR